MSGDVLVFGAGFTKAFFDHAPLMVDDFSCAELAAKCVHMPAAEAILGAEMAANGGKVNLERLMTRLSSGMPYDGRGAAREQYAWLLTQLEVAFAKRIEDATSRPSVADGTLSALAAACVDRDITCITFNYDQVIDERLWRVKSIVESPRGQTGYWHPDGGYGFFCKPSTTVVATGSMFMDAASPLLLKLHGSLNWRPKLGSKMPYSVDDIVHHEEWMPIRYPDDPHSVDLRARHLEDQPFIVPPVLTKSDLVAQPILRYVWTLAHERLALADSVTFIGYSFPPSDLSGQFLFSEAIAGARRQAVKVVNLVERGRERERLIERYSDVLPGLERGQFYWLGAVRWAEDFVSASGRRNRRVKKTAGSLEPA